MGAMHAQSTCTCIYGTCTCSVHITFELLLDGGSILDHKSTSTPENVVHYPTSMYLPVVPTTEYNSTISN